MNVPTVGYKCSNYFKKSEIFTQSYIDEEVGDDEDELKRMNSINRLYQDYLRYSQCIHNDFNLGNACGPRDLWKTIVDRGTVDEDEVEVNKRIYVNQPELNLCIWRLFNEDGEKGQQDLSYDFDYNFAMTKNVEFVLFDFDPVQGKSVIVDEFLDEGIIVKDMAELKREAEYDPIEISYSDFGHPNVFLMARKIDMNKNEF